jgi:hypothetical protein
MLTSPECSVKVSRRKVNVKRSLIRKKDDDKNESVSILCKDVIADGSVCKLNPRANEKDDSRPVTMNIEEEDLDKDQWRFHPSLNNYVHPENTNALGHSAVSTLDLKKNFAKQYSWYKHTFTPMITKTYSANPLSNYDNSIDDGKKLPHFSSHSHDQDLLKDHMVQPETNGARGNHIFDWMKSFTAG